VNYLLDTNACVALINGTPSSVRAKFQKATDKGAKVFVSSIALSSCGRALQRVRAEISTESDSKPFFQGHCLRY
jgi:predicted nucleic acid-binding protein